MYGICHTSNVRSTRIGHASSVLAPRGGLENGMIVAVGDLAVGETDIRDVEAVNAEAMQPRIGIIASPEVIKGLDTMENRQLGNFHIEEGGVADEYDLVVGDRFEVSDNLISLGEGVASLEKAKYLTVKGMKYEAVAEAPAKGVVLKINGIKNPFATRVLAPQVYNYKLVKVTVERI